MTVSFLNGSDVHEYIHSFSQYFLNFYSTWCITSSVLYCAVYKVESDMGPVFLRVSRIKSMFMDNYNTINTVLNDIFKSWEKEVWKFRRETFKVCLKEVAFERALEQRGTWNWRPWQGGFGQRRCIPVIGTKNKGIKTTQCRIFINNNKSLRLAKTSFKLEK